MEFNAEDLIKKALEGRVLNSVEHGFSSNLEDAVENGERYLPLPAKIQKVWFGSDCDRDAVIYLEFEGREDYYDEPDEGFYIYIDESITII